ncbi:CidA/LrgA family protein [Paraburkholderia sacchari]|uniref:CidA/LrgA family protein n=1 Tax=Paraburkholderia sacchari TaxID=159450 RepID=A0A8T6ZAE0_9BURK|nr:CidA/LrgA family protein [Paraburkholderia sacchari]
MRLAGALKRAPGKYRRCPPRCAFASPRLHCRPRGPPPRAILPNPSHAPFLAALLIFQCLGESVSYVFSLPVPGPVIGMLLLFAFAMFRPNAAEAIEPTALELLRHLSLLFIPAGVGIMVSAQAVRGEALAVIASLAVSTTLGIAVTALVTRALLRRQRGRENTGEGA